MKYLIGSTGLRRFAIPEREVESIGLNVDGNGIVICANRDWFEFCGMEDDIEAVLKHLQVAIDYIKGMNEEMDKNA